MKKLREKAKSSVPTMSSAAVAGSVMDPGHMQKDDDEGDELAILGGQQKMLDKRSRSTPTCGFIEASMGVR